MTYKYSLDTSSKKFICPNCNKKKFVRYVDNESKNYLSNEFGRCDRQSSCSYHKPPNSNAIITTSKTEYEIIKPSYIENSIVQNSNRKYAENNFYDYLLNHFSDEEIQTTFTKYSVGTSKHWNGATVFWQIDKFNKVRTGKIMLLNSQTGKRVKKPFPHINWVHKVLNIVDFNLKQCLFGEHLINETSEDKTIALVESEKTAITMSLFLKNYTWIATGSKQNLKYELLLPIKKFRIVLFPDFGEYVDWSKKANELKLLGFNITCSKILEDKNYSKGTDLADVYFKLSDEEIQSNFHQVSLTPYETEIKRISNEFPLLKTLIKTFDLIDDKGNGINLDNL